MKDETYAFISDVKDKGSIGRSARHRRTHTGKGGRVRLPSDNLSKKEIMKMSGECKSYRLNDPMTWKEFMSMPPSGTGVGSLSTTFKCPADQALNTLKQILGEAKVEISVMWRVVEESMGG